MAVTDPGPAQVPEPYAGYSDATVSDIKKRIADTPEGSAREDLKAAVRAFESNQDDPRQGVLAATEPTVDTVPPVAGVAGVPSERPDLITAAEQRAANRKERVISTRKED